MGYLPLGLVITEVKRTNHACHSAFDPSGVGKLSTNLVGSS